MFCFDVTTGARPTGVAVDPQLQLLFYTDEVADTISVATYSGANRKTIVSSLDAPRGLAVDQTRR